MPSQRQIYQRFISLAWKPKLYGVNEIVNLFGLSPEKAGELIICVTGVEDTTQWIPHHDLKDFVQDEISIAVLPTQHSDAAKWLLNDRGWTYNAQYSRYCYQDPQNPVYRHNLRVAVEKQLNRDYLAAIEILEANAPPRERSRIISVELITPPLEGESLPMGI